MLSEEQVYKLVAGDLVTFRERVYVVMGWSPSRRYVELALGGKYVQSVYTRDRKLSLATPAEQLAFKLTC